MQGENPSEPKVTDSKPRANSSNSGRTVSLSFKVPQVSKISRPSSKRWKSVMLAVLLVGVAVLSGFGGAWLQTHSNNGISGDLNSQKQIVTSQSQLFNQIAKTVGPSVVSVNVSVTSSSSGVQDIFGGIFGAPQAQEQQGAGTGVIINDEGVIMTNRHVVPEGTSKVSVTLSDGTELKDVSVIGRTNTSDTLDVAFLKINDAQGHKLVAADLGDSSAVQVGDGVVAIGNALGQFQNTVTSGIISGYGRSVQASSRSGSADTENLNNLFQTDAAINAGNSGGPLVNMNGQVIGINTAVASDSQNIGFAIPINDIKGLISQVLKSGKVTRPYLGVRYVSLTADVAGEYNLKVSRGAFIPPSSQNSPSVISGSPADKAGVKPKDVITQVNGISIDQTHSLTSLLGKYQPGEKVKLTVVREGKTINTSVTLGTLPDQL